MCICIWWLGFVRSGCNAATAAGEKLKYENLDGFLKSMRGMYESVGPDLKMWKADIDSAFRHVPLLCVASLLQAHCCMHAPGRRIPLLPAHREHAHGVFKHNGNVIVAKHLSLMFGAVSSVYHWERVGTGDCTFAL